MALHEGASNRLRGKALGRGPRDHRERSARCAIGAFAAIGPIGAGVAPELPSGHGHPVVDAHVSRCTGSCARCAATSTPRRLYSLALVERARALGALALRYRVRHPADLSLDAPPTPLGDGRWPRTR